MKGGTADQDISSSLEAAEDINQSASKEGKIFKLQQQIEEKREKVTKNEEKCEVLRRKKVEVENLVRIAMSDKENHAKRE